MEIPSFEYALIYIGQLSSIAGSIFMLIKGSRKIGALFLLSFILQIQSLYVITHTELEGQGACWGTGKTYYECLPTWVRISSYAGQLGNILIGVAIYFSAIKIIRGSSDS